jgi:hypothetical protein
MKSIAHNIPKSELKHIENIEVLLDFANQTMSRVPLRYREERLKKIYVYLAFGDIFTKCSALTTLLRESKTIACNVVLRSLVELFINIEYVLADRSNVNLIQFYIEDNNERIRLANKTIDFLIRNPNHVFFGGQEDTPKHWEDYILKIQKESNKLKVLAKKKSSLKLPNLKERAMFVDKVRKTKIEWWYIHLYWLFSLDTHGSTRGLEKHLINKDNELYFELEGDIKDIEKVAVTTYMILYCVTERFFTKFGLPKEDLVIFKKQFKDYAKRPVEHVGTK